MFVFIFECPFGEFSNKKRPSFGKKMQLFKTRFPHEKLWFLLFQRIPRTPCMQAIKMNSNISTFSMF